MSASTSSTNVSRSVLANQDLFSLYDIDLFNQDDNENDNGGGAIGENVEFLVGDNLEADENGESDEEEDEEEEEEGDGNGDSDEKGDEIDNEIVQGETSPKGVNSRAYHERNATELQTSRLNLSSAGVNPGKNGFGEINRNDSNIKIFNVDQVPLRGPAHDPLQVQRQPNVSLQEAQEAAAQLRRGRDGNNQQEQQAPQLSEAQLKAFEEAQQAALRLEKGKQPLYKVQQPQKQPTSSSEAQFHSTQEAHAASLHNINQQANQQQPAHQQPKARRFTKAEYQKVQDARDAALRIEEMKKLVEEVKIINKTLLPRKPYLPPKIANSVSFCNNEEKLDMFKCVNREFLGVDVNLEECFGASDSDDREELMVRLWRQLLRKVGVSDVEIERVVGRISAQSQSIDQRTAGTGGIGANNAGGVASVPVHSLSTPIQVVLPADSPSAAGTKRKHTPRRKTPAPANETGSASSGSPTVKYLPILPKPPASQLPTPMVSPISINPTNEEPTGASAASDFPDHIITSNVNSQSGKDGDCSGDSTHGNVMHDADHESVMGILGVLVGSLKGLSERPIITGPVEAPTMPTQQQQQPHHNHHMQRQQQFTGSVNNPVFNNMAQPQASGQHQSRPNQCIPPVPTIPNIGLPQFGNAPPSGSGHDQQFFAPVPPSLGLHQSRQSQYTRPPLPTIPNIGLSQFCNAAPLVTCQPFFAVPVPPSNRMPKNLFTGPMLPNNNPNMLNMMGMNQQRQLNHIAMCNSLNVDGMSVDTLRSILSMNMNAQPSATMPAQGVNPTPTVPPIPIVSLPQGDRSGSSSRAKSNKRRHEEVEPADQFTVPVVAKAKKVRGGVPEP
ncbi:hypothetical protein HDU76_000324 [Blyttiomyces sp. JEL0837]|nr:hypothetical protein HDU76_000324 [Blyttiomyces sp. JEL0837]